MGYPRYVPGGEQRVQGLAECLLQLQAEGRQCVAAGELRHRLGVSQPALAAAITRQLRKGTIARLHPGFYVLLRPEDGIYGLPDPLHWLDPLMQFLGHPYRVSLWRAAALHGSSHQAAMAVHVITPRLLRPIERGRVQVRFLHQQPELFAVLNRSPWINVVPTPRGYATLAGVELTLVDCLRYVRQLGGIDHAAQMVKDLAGEARPDRLADLAPWLESTTIRRLGYLLEKLGYPRLAQVFKPFAAISKNWVPLSSFDTHLFMVGDTPISARDSTWKLILNHSLELDD